MRCRESETQLGLRAQVPSFVEGGAFWFTDLTIPDPYYALPIMSASVFMAMVELNAADGMEGQDPAIVSRLKMGMRFMAPLMVLFGGTMPAVRGPLLKRPLCQSYCKAG